MRDLSALEQYRVSMESSYGWNGDSTQGGFVLPSPIDGQPLRVIVSCGGGWDHISVSRASRTPNWPEMEFIKRKFFRDDEVAMQLHVPVNQHVNYHPRCLHLWRPQHTTIPQPPKEMVA